jgi:putative tryptophan/tyrosine transport system substrate-binding protein
MSFPYLPVLRRAPNVRQVWQTALAPGAGGLFILASVFSFSQRRLLVALAARHALPAVYPLREYAEVGGLISYGPSQSDAYRRAGVYVGRILKGEKPGDRPVELAIKFDLVINLARKRHSTSKFRHRCSRWPTR